MTILLLAVVAAGLAALTALNYTDRLDTHIDTVLDDPIPLWPAPTQSDMEFYEWADRTMLLFAASDVDDELHDRRMNR